jgi:protein-S-isoprenylcysteine O-methyltransferase Ste14
MAVIFPVGLYYFFKSGILKEKVDHRGEGMLALLTLRPLAAARAIGVIAFIINPAWMAWSAVPLPLWARWMCVVVGAPGAIIVIWTLRSLGTNLTDTVAVREDATLIIDGPYRWVRHPFYIGFGLGFAADALATANWFVALLGGLVLVLLILRAEPEEQRLIDRFGDDYRNYMAETGRFLPRLR